MKDMDKNNEGVTGDELDEDDGFGDDIFTGDELDEDDGFGDEMFSGDELSEDDGSGDIPGEKGRPGEKTQDPGSALPKKTGGKWVWLMGAMALVAFMVAGSFFAIHQKRVAQRIKAQALPVVSVPIPPKNEIWLKDFLVPLEPEHLYVCVTFSVVIQSWDNSVNQVMAHKKQWFRGVVYDMIINKVHTEKETPSMETFREWVRQAVRKALPDSHIDTVNIRNFLVV